MPQRLRTACPLPQSSVADCRIHVPLPDARTGGVWQGNAVSVCAAEGGSVFLDIKGGFDNALVPSADKWLVVEHWPHDFNPGVTTMMISMADGTNGSKSSITFTNANGSTTYAILLCYRKY